MTRSLTAYFRFCQNIAVIVVDAALSRIGAVLEQQRKNLEASPRRAPMLFLVLGWNHLHIM